MSEVYFEVRVTDKGGMEIHSCGTLEEIYDIVAGAVIGSTQAVQKQLGSDMVDVVEHLKPGSGCEVDYVWFNTGIEMDATKAHMAYWRSRCIAYEKMMVERSRKAGAEK